MTKPTAKYSRIFFLSGSRRSAVILTVILIAFYGLLQSSHWYPGIDSTFYLITSKSLVTGQGYSLMGVPVAKIPPGWSWLLAMVLKATGSFAVINLVPMLLIIASLVSWYFIMLRYAAPPTAFGTVLTVGILYHWHRATYELLTEGLFLFLLAAGVILALHINEGRRGSWRMPLLLAVVIMTIFVRWAAVMAFPIMAGALLQGETKPAFNRRWLLALALALATVITFIVLRGGMKKYAASFHEAAPPPSVTETMNEVQEESLKPQAPGRDTTAGRLAKRIAVAGYWPARLYWPPAEIVKFVKDLPWLSFFIDACGWVLLLLFALRVRDAVRRRQWIWLGAAVYAVCLFSIWNQPNGRYLMPISILLTLGIIQPQHLPEEQPDTRRRIHGAFKITFLASVLLANLLIYAQNVSVAKSEDYYSKALAGETKNIISAAEYVRRHNIDGNLIFTNDRFRNFGRTQKNHFTVTAFYFLTGRKLAVAPASAGWREPDDNLLAWAVKGGFQYYLERAETNPWRLWHMPLPRLQSFVTGIPAKTKNEYYILYRIEDGKAKTVDLSVYQASVTRVP